MALLLFDKLHLRGKRERNLLTLSFLSPLFHWPKFTSWGTNSSGLCPTPPYNHCVNRFYIPKHCWCIIWAWKCWRSPSLHRSTQDKPDSKNHCDCYHGSRDETLRCNSGGRLGCLHGLEPVILMRLTQSGELPNLRMIMCNIQIRIQTFHKENESEKGWWTHIWPMFFALKFVTLPSLWKMLRTFSGMLLNLFLH